MRTAGCVLVLTVLAIGTYGVPAARADKFTYQDEDGKTVEVEARLYATGQEMMALEHADGSITLVPETAVMKREPGRDPEPTSPQAKLEELQAEFTPELFRGVVSDPYVIGVVLMAPLPKTSEKRVEASLKKSALYMQSIQRTFESFARQAKVTVEKPKFPLVVLIFETDEIFEAYAAKQTGGRGLSAGNIAGFYSSLTNALYIRMSECYTFATPLHEAIHQQCFNTGVLQRLAPVPKWFAEGMATGFEGAGDKVKGDPLKLNQQYAKLIAQTNRIPGDLDWDIIATEDGAFVGDIFAGEAYFHAWSMHWLLFSRHRNEYAKFLQEMSALQPLTEGKAEDHAKTFVAAFGKRPVQFQKEFIPAFQSAIKRERFAPSRDDLDGVISRQMNLAAVDVTAASDGLTIGAKGILRNISPLRDMAYYVVVHSDSGSYADWYIPKLNINATTPLRPQTLNKVLPGGFGGPGNGFFVRVKAAPADSEENQKWSRGQLPTLAVQSIRRK